MAIGIWTVMALYALIGGISTMVLVISIPAIIIWKIYRKLKFSTPLTC